MIAARLFAVFECASAMSCAGSDADGVMPICGQPGGPIVTPGIEDVRYLSDMSLNDTELLQEVTENFFAGNKRYRGDVLSGWGFLATTAIPYAGRGCPRCPPGRGRETPPGTDRARGTGRFGRRGRPPSRKNGPLFAGKISILHATPGSTYLW